MLGPQIQKEIDQAYSDGIHDLAEKILGLIFQTDGEISIQELSDFLEAELYRELNGGAAEEEELVANV